MNNEPLSPKSIYDLFAYVGFRKYFHLGGREATKELIELCHIDKTSIFWKLVVHLEKLLALSLRVSTVR